MAEHTDTKPIDSHIEFIFWDNDKQHSKQPLNI